MQVNLNMLSSYSAASPAKLALPLGVSRFRWEKSKHSLIYIDLMLVTNHQGNSIGLPYIYCHRLQQIKPQHHPLPKILLARFCATASSTTSTTEMKTINKSNAFQVPSLPCSKTKKTVTMLQLKLTEHILSLQMALVWSSLHSKRICKKHSICFS